MQSTSLRGYVYYDFFIDDYFRDTWIYFLNKKDEVFENFKQFKSLVEKIYEKKIKTLRSDNEGEFTLGEFNDYYKESRIKRDLIIPYNPQHNNVDERKNIYIMEEVKSMIHDQDIAMYLWEEAGRIDFYVHNIFSHSALGNKTPEEMFTGEKP